MASNKRKITVRFSSRLKTEMQKAVIQLDYGLHGKSRWLEEAIKLFLEQSNYIELVETGIDINQADLSHVEAFYLDDETIKRVKSALVSVRIQYPLFEGVQSAFIRACVIYSLYRQMLRK